MNTHSPKKKRANSLEAAVKKGAFMVFAKDWETIKEFPEASVSRALYLACRDCWNDESHKHLGNGFLYIPEAHISDLCAEEEDRHTLAAYLLLMDNNKSARKKYIRNNPLLSEALKQLGDRQHGIPRQQKNIVPDLQPTENIDLNDDLPSADNDEDLIF